MKNKFLRCFCGGTYLFFALLNVNAKTLSNTELSNYFDYIDYRDEQSQSGLVSVENLYVLKAKEILASLSENPSSFTNPANEKKAAILVYAAMFMANTNNGFEQGHFPSEKLQQTLATETQGKDVSTILLERKKLAVDLLTLAEKLNPKDGRITAWLSSGVFKYEEQLFGRVSEETLDWIVELGVQDPIFNLINALVMNVSYDFGKQREDQLFQLVQKMSGPDSPCARKLSHFFRRPDKKCKVGKSSPHGIEGVMTFFADTYLKEAFKIKTENQAMASEYAQKARYMYLVPKYLGWTKSWSEKSEIKDRIKMAQNFSSTSIEKFNAYKATSSYKNLYNCASCHHTGKISGLIAP